MSISTGMNKIPNDANRLTSGLSLSGFSPAKTGGTIVPCDNCGGPMREETSHHRCDRCGFILPCCEGAPL